jgi:hypothetical protein
MDCHFECQQDKGKSQHSPCFFALHLYLKILNSLDHHRIHFFLHKLIDLDRIDASKNRPVR